MPVGAPPCNYAYMHVCAELCTGVQCVLIYIDIHIKILPGDVRGRAPERPSSACFSPCPGSRGRTPAVSSVLTGPTTRSQRPPSPTFSTERTLSHFWSCDRITAGAVVSRCGRMGSVATDSDDSRKAACAVTRRRQQVKPSPQDPKASIPLPTSLSILGRGARSSLSCLRWVKEAD